MASWKGEQHKEQRIYVLAVFEDESKISESETSTIKENVPGFHLSVNRSHLLSIHSRMKPLHNIAGRCCALVQLVSES